MPATDRSAIGAIAPLRKIKREVPGSLSGVWLDLLECGHTLAHASDIYGQRHPERRRCWKCRKGHAVDVELADAG